MQSSRTVYKMLTRQDFMNKEGARLLADVLSYLQNLSPCFPKEAAYGKAEGIIEFDARRAYFAEVCWTTTAFGPTDRKALRESLHAVGLRLSGDSADGEVTLIADFDWVCDGMLYAVHVDHEDDRFGLVVNVTQEPVTTLGDPHNSPFQAAV